MAGSKSVSYLTFVMVLVIALLHGNAEGEVKPPKGRPGPPSSSQQKVKTHCSSGNPCDAAYCERYPLADCRPSLSDPCKAEFFLDQRKPLQDCDNGGKCSEICPRHLNPMCGSDGKTYGNECTFAAAKCISRGKLRLKKEGECETNIPTRVAE